MNSTCLGLNYKIIYTAKLDNLAKLEIPESTVHRKLTISILKDAHTQGVGSPVGSVNSLYFRHFSQDKISVEPETAITVVNRDVVSHTILSGTENGDRHERFIADGKISTSTILPGPYVDITLNNAVFHSQ